MIVNKSILSLAATTALLGAVTIPAMAVVSSFGFTPSGSGAITFTGPTLDTATSITVPADEKTNGVVSGAFVGLPSGTPVTLSPLSLSTGVGETFSVTFGGDTYSFSTTSPIDTTLTAQLGPGTTSFISASNSFSELGYLTDTAGHITSPALGTLTAAFTQPTFPNIGDVNATFSFSTNVPITTTPEPGNVAMLVGLGLSSVSILVRRRRK